MKLNINLLIVNILFNVKLRDRKLVKIKTFVPIKPINYIFTFIYKGNTVYQKNS